MAISNVKSALATDLATITVANGYNTTIDTVFKVPKFLKDVDPTKMPAFSVFLTNAPAKEFDEANIGCDLIFTIIAYTSVEQDIDETGDLEIALFKMYSIRALQAFAQILVKIPIRPEATKCLYFESTNSSTLNPM